MRRITAIACSILFIVCFRSAFGGNSAGHRVRIVVRYHPIEMEKKTGTIVQTESDLFSDPFRMDGERFTASLGLEGNSHHFRWAQKKSIRGKYCVTMDNLDEIENAFPVLLKNADCSEIRKFTDPASNNEKRPLIFVYRIVFEYCFETSEKLYRKL